jgi:pimeloyl-ACP methyl ester carboxylesterase
MKAYLISGIAADRRLFRRIQLPAGIEPVYIDWINPVRQETLSNYAHRLAENINAGEPFILIGTSLGGIMATEIAMQLRPAITIIIGSIPVNSQLPDYFRIAGILKIHKLIPGSLYKVSAILKHYFSRGNAEDRKIIIQMISETDGRFIRWGIDAVLNWKNSRLPESLFHIHGTRDEMFPYSLTSPTHTILKGDHVIVINRADEVNEMIREILTTNRVNLSVELP